MAQRKAGKKGAKRKVARPKKRAVKTRSPRRVARKPVKARPAASNPRLAALEAENRRLRQELAAARAELEQRHEPSAPSGGGETSELPF